jgi:poly(hydroxyalkanoate) granule-associated protein
MLGVAELQEKVVGSVRNIWLAGLGAAALAQEEGSKLFDTLVQKGEDVEKQGGSPVAKMKESFKEATDKATSAWDNLAQKVDEQVTISLHRMGVPTREEIATLTRRVDALILSVDKLRAKAPAAQTDTAGEVPAETVGLKG